MKSTSRQVQPRMLNLLRARTLIYRRAKNYQAVGLVISLGLPLVGLAAAALFSASKPFIALFALTFSYLEVLFFDPWPRTQIKTDAKLQEDLIARCWEWTGTHFWPAVGSTLNKCSRMPVEHSARKTRSVCWIGTH